MSIANWLELQVLNYVFNNTAPTAIATVYAKLHLTDPGEDCTSGAAANTTRQAVSFGAAAAGPPAIVSNDAPISWTSVSNSETYGWISLWDNSTAGNALWSGQLTVPKAVNAGDTFTIATGDLDVTLD
jgi:hypothetical protein